MKKRIAALTHIYYENAFGLLADSLIKLKKAGCSFYFNLCVENESTPATISKIEELLPGSTIIVTPNKGRDIGGKLALIDLLLKIKDESEYIVVLHDKISPQISTGDAWREKLLNIIQKENIERAVELFDANPRLGLIGAKGVLENEYDPSKDHFNSTCNDYLKHLRSKFSFAISDYRFVAGTMYWVRKEPYEQFFSKNSPLSIRASLESGNILDHSKGSMTHSWERVLSWIVTDQGYTMREL